MFSQRQVFCLAWSSDGTRLATGSQDHSIKLWTVGGDGGVDAVRAEAELKGHTEAVMYMRWHPINSDRLASTSSNERCVRFWDARVGKNTATLSTPGHNLYLAWTGDGNYMAAGSKEDIVCAIDVRTMKITGTVSYRYQINELGFLSKSGILLQGTGKEGEIELLRWPEQTRIGSFAGHSTSVLSLTVDSQESLIATGGADATCCVWDAKEFICTHSYYHMDHPVRALGFSYDSKYLAMVGEDPCVFVEDVQENKSLGRCILRGSPEDCAWHPRRHVLAYPYETYSDCFVEFRSLSDDA